MKNILYVLIFGFILLMACDDFFEENLEDKTVVLIGPSDALQTKNSSLTFWWDKVEGASKYNLQVVSPDFNTIEKLLVDTNITNNQFEVQLFPGDFQWRVKAFNGSSETPYTTYSIIVDDTLDLSGQDIILKLPAPNIATSKSTVDFTWQVKPNAEYYTFRIKLGDWETGEDVVFEIVEGSEISLSIDEFSEGDYSWGVRAENSVSSSLYRNRSFIIDRTNPNLPSLTSPAQGEIKTDTLVTFTWTRPADQGSAILEDILIGTDSTFVTGIVKDIKGKDRTYPTNFSVSVGQSQKYYWKIKSIDKAGNESNYTDFRRFTVKNEK